MCSTAMIGSLEIGHKSGKSQGILKWKMSGNPEELQNNNRKKTSGKQTNKSNLVVKIIAKLERKQSNAQQNMEQTQNPTMGATINNNNSITTLVWTAAYAFNAFY